MINKSYYLNAKVENHQLDDLRNSTYGKEVLRSRKTAVPSKARERVEIDLLMFSSS